MSKRFYPFLIWVAMMWSSSLSAQLSTWTTDLSHSTVLFSVRHVLTPFYGQFKEFDVTLNWDPSDASKSSVIAKVKVASVQTSSSERDEWLVTADMFDAGSHPEWTFESTSILAKDGGYVAKGTLKVRGVSKDIEVPFVFLGVMDMGKRGKKAGATAEFTILRSDFGLGKTGGSVADEVKIIVSLELNGK